MRLPFHGTRGLRQAGSAAVGFVLLFAVAICGCRRPTVIAATRIRIGTGSSTGAIDAIGRTFAARLTDELPGVGATTQPDLGLDGNADALERGALELAFEDSETAYVALRKGTASDLRPHVRLRAIGVLFPTAVHIFARRDAHIERISDFRGKRVSIGPPGSYPERAARLLFASYGLDNDDMSVEFDSTDTAVAKIRNGQLAGAVFYVPFSSKALVDLAEAVDVALVPLDHQHIAAVQEASDRAHFLKSIFIPHDTYLRQPHDTLTVGDVFLLLARADLPEVLVHDITRTLFESVPLLARAHAAAASISPELGPRTSIPLHPGAARYYRERELPR